MQIILKPITPKGKKPFDFAALIERELDHESRQIVEDLQAVTSTWKHKPKFVVTNRLGFRTIATASKIFGYVDEGTRPHIIRPRKAKRLRFNAMFKAKSVPNRFVARQGASAPPVVFAMEVHHPGTKARGFTKLVANRSKKRVGRRFQSAITKAVQ